MTIEVCGIPVHYAEYGSGEETVLILQGWGTHLGLYQALAEHLGKHMRVVLPELPGFGSTPEPTRPFSAGDYAEFTLAFLQALRLHRVSIIGHSNGGRIILKLCTGAHEGLSVEKLVFLDAAGIIAPKTAKQKRRQALFRLVKKLLAPFPKRLEAYRRRHGSADYRAASPMMRQTLVKLVTEDLSALLPQITQPSLCIWGTEDKDTPLWMGKIFAERIPDAGLVEVQGAGHYSYLEQPAFVYRVLDSFFGAGV